jgi:hypothetical protein
MPSLRPHAGPNASSARRTCSPPLTRLGAGRTTQLPRRVSARTPASCRRLAGREAGRGFCDLSGWAWVPDGGAFSPSPRWLGGRLCRQQTRLHHEPHFPDRAGTSYCPLTPLRTPLKDRAVSMEWSIEPALAPTLHPRRRSARRPCWLESPAREDSRDGRHQFPLPGEAGGAEGEPWRTVSRDGLGRRKPGSAPDLHETPHRFW